jgi:hypothetical protein
MRLRSISAVNKLLFGVLLTSSIGLTINRAFGYDGCEAASGCSPGSDEGADCAVVAKEGSTIGHQFTGSDSSCAYHTNNGVQGDACGADTLSTTSCN